MFRSPVWIKLALFFRHACETLLYSKIRLNILNMVPLGFHATHHTRLALVSSQMQMRRGKLNMDYKQMYKQKKQFNSLCVICTTLSLATSTKK